MQKRKGKKPYLFSHSGHFSWICSTRLTAHWNVNKHDLQKWIHQGLTFTSFVCSKLSLKQTLQIASILVFCIFLSGLFQMTQIAMQKNELHYRQYKQEFWQLTNSLKKNALTELFRKERKEDFDSRESLELPAKSVSLAIYKTEFLKMSLIIIQTNIDLKLFARYIFFRCISH